MSDYTPTDGEILTAVVLYRAISGVDAPPPTIDTIASPEETARYLGEYQRWLAEHDAKVRAEALREAAQEMDEIEANAEIAECAAYVEGETGRQSVIDAAAEMHEDPAQWVRTRAGRIEREAGLK